MDTRCQSLVGFRIPYARFQIPKPNILDSTRLDSPAAVREMSSCSSLPLPPGFPKQKFHGVIQLVFCISYRPVNSKVQPPRCYYVKTRYGEQKCKPVLYEYLNCRWCIFQLLACKLSKGRDQCVYNHLSVEYLYILPDLYPASFPGSSPTRPPWERGWFISAVYLPAYNS